MLSAGVGLWSLGTLIAPPAAKTSLLALCASRVFVGLGEGLAPSSATGIMAKIVPECVPTFDAPHSVNSATNNQHACRLQTAVTNGSMLFITSHSALMTHDGLQARAGTCSHSGLRQFRRGRSTWASHLRTTHQGGWLAGRVLPVCGIGSYLVCILAPCTAGAGRVGRR